MIKGDRLVYQTNAIRLCASKKLVKTLKLVSSTKFRSQIFVLLSEVIRVSKSALYQWGNDFELDKMPKLYEHILAYALAAYKKQGKIAARYSTNSDK